MSKKGGKATPRGQLDKAENRTTPTNEFIPGIPDQEWEILQEIEEVNALIEKLFLHTIMYNLVSSLGLITWDKKNQLQEFFSVGPVCCFSYCFSSYDLDDRSLFLTKRISVSVLFIKYFISKEVFFFQTAVHLSLPAKEA